MSRPDCNTPIALGLLLPLLLRPSLGQVSGALIACEHGKALEEGGDVDVPSPAVPEQRLHPPTSPRWEPSGRPGPAEPACRNQDVYSRQARVSTTRTQRGSTVDEGLFCTARLVFARFPGEPRHGGCWRTPPARVTLGSRCAPMASDNDAPPR